MWPTSTQNLEMGRSMSKPKIPKFCKCGCGEEIVLNPGAKWRKYFSPGHSWKDRSYQAGLQIIKDLKSKPCVDCGKVFPAFCMDFDHRPGEKKLGSPAMFFHNQEKFWAEVAKCDLVCACCHRIRTFSRGAFTRYDGDMV